jgi:hypothetical protein
VPCIHTSTEGGGIWLGWIISFGLQKEGGLFVAHEKEGRGIQLNEDRGRGGGREGGRGGLDEERGRRQGGLS